MEKTILNYFKNNFDEEKYFDFESTEEVQELELEIEKDDDNYYFIEIKIRMNCNRTSDIGGSYGDKEFEELNYMEDIVYEVLEIKIYDQNDFEIKNEKLTKKIKDLFK